MESFKFDFDVNSARDLRDAINDRVKYSVELKADKANGTNGPYRAWNRLCATMDRLEDTLAHINEMELGNVRNGVVAFDFYEFINCSFVVIDCIKAVIQAFGIDKKITDTIEKSQEVFGTKYGEDGNDGKFFEYIRSLCSVHPLCTSRQKEYLNGSSFHCCRFVAWTDRGYLRSSQYNNADLIALVYATNKNNPINIRLYIKEFEEYLKKWIDFIPTLIEAKNNYVDEKYAKLEKEPMKKIDEFGANIVAYIEYLKDEYIRRIDEANSYILDEFAEVFKIKLSNKNNQEKLNKYKNAILYSLTFLHNSLQAMNFIGFENTGIKYPERNIETELYIELEYPSIIDCDFSEYSYSFQKTYKLSKTSEYKFFDKQYARDLLEEPKDLINKYVLFTNQEPDEEVYVLVKVALYLDSLTRKCIINKNIPNKLLYRENLMAQSEIDNIQKEKPIQEASQEDIDELMKTLSKYGG